MLGFKEVLPEKIFTETTTNIKNVAVDSLMLEAASASDDSVPEKDTLTHTKITFEETYGVKFPAEDFDDYKGFQHLIQFYEKLMQLEKTGEGNVRIAYFGDSMTDGDMIVKDLRTSMQNRFGGEGVGFVSIASESAQSRSTVTHQFSTNWKTQSYLNVKHPTRPFGVNGRVFFVKHDTVNTTWVRYAGTKLNHLTSLNNPTLFYGRSGNRDASLRVVVGKDTLVKKLNPSSLLNTLKLSDNYKGFKADFIKADSIPFYGFNFDNGRGVHIDNFSTRGNSGLPNSTFNASLMKAFNDKLGYDLIVLQYGTNILNNGSLKYNWYERSMTHVVEHLRECFPGTTILIISTADKSTKYGTEMKTDSAVVPVAMAQKRYAVKTNSAFINLYTLMGGDGSMVRWVEDEPARANKDYTHFNFRGSKQIADLIYGQLNSGYEKYKALRGGKPLPKEVIDTAAPVAKPVPQAPAAKPADSFKTVVKKTTPATVTPKVTTPAKGTTPALPKDSAKKPATQPKETKVKPVVPVVPPVKDTTNAQ
ncbi:hypothetical protein ACLI1A_16665 [Flavobacterium sp. RHBU_3]|uniref:hypothetical protein n=1 Tax=Flavobacterium sp. RHBU_3 TaxID=3391184 RepID=UPI0039851A9E